MPGRDVDDLQDLGIDETSGEIAVKLPVDAEVGLALLDEKGTVLWANPFHLKRFKEHKLVGSTCYEAAARFSQRCAWCRGTIENGRVRPAHALAACPIDVEAEDSPESGELTYSQIVWLPHFTKHERRPLCLELVFDMTEAETDIFARGQALYGFCHKLCEFISSAAEADAEVLILYGTVAEEGLGFDEGLLLLPAGSGAEEDGRARLSGRRLRREELSRHVWRGLPSAVCSEDAEGFALRIAGSVEKVPSDTLTPQDYDAYEEVVGTMGPVRLGTRRLATRVAPLKGVAGVLVMTDKAKNSFVLEYRVTELAVFLSGIHAALELAEQARRVRVAAKNLESQLEDLAGKEGWNKELATIVPLAIGKVHDVTRLYRNVVDYAEMLESLNPRAADFDARRSQVVGNMRGMRDRLRRLAASMKTPAMLAGYHFRRADVVALAKGAVELRQADMDEIADDQHINFRAPVRPHDQSVFAEVDADLITHVFDNLIDNAIRTLRRTQRKRKEIITTVTEDDTLDRIAVTVHDNGPGISVLERDMIFTLHYSSQQKATGLGLYYVRYIIENIHRGGIAVDSRLGEWTKFTFWVPRTQSSSPV